MFFSFEQFADLYAVHGYWVLFVGIMLENAGIPVPGETALLVAAVLSSPEAGGRLHLWSVIAVATTAAVIGDNLGYWLGRELARPRIARGKRFLFLTPKRVAQAEGYFAKYGAATVFFGRFIAILRIAAGPAAGVAGMAWWRFFLANAAGAAVWATTISLLGYFMGGAWETLHRWLGRGAWVLAGVFFLAVVVWHFALYRSRKPAGEGVPPTSQGSHP